MALSIVDNLPGLNGLMSDNESFRRVYEDHLEIIRKDPKTTETAVSGKQLEVHRFNWIGLLNELKIPQELHWFTIRLNNSANWTDLDESMQIVLVPDFAFIKYLYSSHVSVGRNKRIV